MLAHPTMTFCSEECLGWFAESAPRSMVLSQWRNSNSKCAYCGERLSEVEEMESAQVS